MGNPAMKPTPPDGASEPPVITEWRGLFENGEVNLLHAECFEHRLFEDDWWTQVNRFSLGWVCLRRSTKLIGFVNVAWDGGVHAFVLDTMITTALRRRGLATDLIREATRRAREAGANGFTSISIPTSDRSISTLAASAERMLGSSRSSNSMVQQADTKHFGDVAVPGSSGALQNAGQVSIPADPAISAVSLGLRFEPAFWGLAVEEGLDQRAQQLGLAHDGGVRGRRQNGEA